MFEFDEENIEKEHKDFYKTSLSKYGVDDVRALHWNSPKTQEVRFKTLYKIGNFHNKTILDLGCGTGGFYEFLLRKKTVPKQYIGVDFMEEFISFAKNNFPLGKWIKSDFFELPKAKYDYIICNGALNIKKTDNMKLLYQFLTYFLPQTNIGLGLTLLKYAKGYEENPMIYTYSVHLVDELLSHLNIKYKIQTGYIDNDFAVFIYK